MHSRWVVSFICKVSGPSSSLFLICKPMVRPFKSYFIIDRQAWKAPFQKIAEEWQRSHPQTTDFRCPDTPSESQASLHFFIDKITVRYYIMLLSANRRKGIKEAAAVLLSLRRDHCGPLGHQGAYSPFLCFHGEQGLLVWNGQLYRISRERDRNGERTEFEAEGDMWRLLEGLVDRGGVTTQNRPALIWPQ